MAQPRHRHSKGTCVVPAEGVDAMCCRAAASTSWRSRMCACCTRTMRRAPRHIQSWCSRCACAIAAIHSGKILNHDFMQTARVLCDAVVESEGNRAATAGRHATWKIHHTGLSMSGAAAFVALPRAVSRPVLACLPRRSTRASGGARCASARRQSRSRTTTRMRPPTPPSGATSIRL